MFSTKTASKADQERPDREKDRQFQLVFREPGKRALCKRDEEYRGSVISWLESVKDNSEMIRWIASHSRELLQVYVLNFDPIRDLLESLYCDRKRGSDAYDPVAMLRSCLLMEQFCGKITAWVKELRTSSALAVFSGFVSSRTPSVGAFYKFFMRLEDGPYYPKCRYRIRASEMRRARNPFRAVQKKPSEKPQIYQNCGVLKKLVEQLKKEQNEPVPNDLEKRLNEILLQVAVKPSAQLGLMEAKNLTIAGDGSTVPTQASHFGKPTCDCHKQGIYKCDHPRKFSDVDAAWGWDNREDDFVFGYRYYQFVTTNKKHDLPIYLTMGPCNTHEAVMCVKGMERMYKQNRKLWPDAKIRRFGGDAIHDIYAVYTYFAGKELRYAIPYANKPAKCNYIGDKQIAVNEQGVPICPGGIPMRYHGKDRRGGLVYTCPAKRPTHRNGQYIYLTHRDLCPLGSLCRPDSKLGPIVIVKPKDDLRICPMVPRDSDEYKELIQLRSCCERSLSTKKQTYGMKFRKTRVMAYAFIRLTFISLLEHSRAWIAEGISPGTLPI